MNKYILSMVIILFFSCENASEEETNCKTTSISYTNDMKEIINQSCATTGCHVAGTGRSILDNYSNLKDQVDNGSIFDLVINKKTMPPGVSLSSCDYEKFEIWLNEGAFE